MTAVHRLIRPRTSCTRLFYSRRQAYMNEALDIMQTGPLGVNTYVIPLAEGMAVVVDPAACAFTHDEDKITGRLRSTGRTPCGICITHGHFDHITGIGALKKAFPSCPVAIHRDDSRALGAGAASVQAPALETMGLEQFLAALHDVPLADVTFMGGETLDSVFSGNRGTQPANGVLPDAVRRDLAGWRIIHTPGHSAGSVCLYSAERKELISGDTLFYQSYGRTDLGGDENAIIRSLSMLRDTVPGDTKVYPGHGEYGFRLSDGL